MKTLKRTLFNKIEYRTLENEGKRIIEAVIPYYSKSVDLGGFREVITETAFKRSLSENANIYAYWNHDDSKILGNTKSGTLELRSEKDGLYCRLILGNTSFANDVWDIINRGDCNNLSFGFIPFEVENRGNLRYLKSVNLKEVSFCVSQPAYEETISVAYTRNKTKKDYTGMKKNLITRSIDLELFEEIINSGDLIKDKETARELINLIDPGILKELTAVETDDPAGGTDRNDTGEEKGKIPEDEKKEILELIDSELQSALQENEKEEEEKE